MAPKKTHKNKIYEGKAKILYAAAEAGHLVQYFKDDATAFNNQKKGVIAGKGVINNIISEFFMHRLAEIGIPTHFIKRLNMREQLVHRVEIIKLEVIIRNLAAGSLVTRLGIKEGERLPRNIIEFCLKDDALGDPLVSEDHILTFGWATPDELEQMIIYAGRINDFMQGVFAAIGIYLVDFKIEFGRMETKDGQLMLVLADEISPDSCRLWDMKSGKKLDKDRFRLDLGAVSDAYNEVANRLGLLPTISDAKGESD
ncbi:MAG: phosphoribosylaminoimidazolesuccinocarboxamide synthase [Alphaproteobacteria bacterium]|nr:phosphoribosylaminoimidazolesuccinocarboxamide synthase [Alphaproteobacteria bacterium]